MRKLKLLIMAGFLFCSCNNSSRNTEAKNKQIVETYFNEVWNKGAVDLPDGLLTENYINHTPSVPNPPKGPLD